MGGMSLRFPFYFLVILLSKVVWTVQIPPQNSLWCGKKEEKQPFSSERRGEAVLNWGPFAYQSNALPLGHTGSPVIILWEDPIYIPPPPPRPPLSAHFYAWLNTHFCQHLGVYFFSKLQWAETFGKSQSTSAIVWTHYEFPPVFHAVNTMSCGVAATAVTVQLLWPVMLHQRLQQQNKTKTTTKTAST